MRHHKRLTSPRTARVSKHANAIIPAPSTSTVHDPLTVITGFSPSSSPENKVWVNNHFVPITEANFSILAHVPSNSK